MQIVDAFFRIKFYKTYSTFFSFFPPQLQLLSLNTDILRDYELPPVTSRAVELPRDTESWTSCSPPAPGILREPPRIPLVRLIYLRSKSRRAKYEYLSRLDRSKRRSE